MKNHKQGTEQIDTILEELKSNELTTIDFDKLTTALEEQKLNLENLSNSNSDLEILRNDYECRISGMVKAISIAGRKQGTMAQSVDLVNKLPGFTTAELVDCYHRVSARFRDMFPASYTQISSHKATGSVMRNPEDFK